MAEIDAFTVKLAELLKHPEDLDKIPALKAEFTRKKAAVDGQLKVGLKEQLELTQSGMGAISESQRIVNQIKEEMMKIDKLCTESQNMIKDFPNIGEVAQVHRNFQLVEAMRENIGSFEERARQLERMLQADEADLDEQKNLLNVHYGLTQLRNIQDEAMEQIRQSSDQSLEGYLRNHFEQLENVVETFDEHIGEACINLLEHVRNGNHSLVVRIALVIEEEEKHDMKIKAMQEAQKEYKDLATKFKSINSGPRQARGYKEKFLQAIANVAHQSLRETEEKFMEEPEKLGKQLRWYFRNLATVKHEMAPLMPKKWKIFKTYTNVYHKQLHDWLIELVDRQDTSSRQILAIIHFREYYYKTMADMGISNTDLQPEVLDDREGELVREWRQLIVNSVDQWMGRMFNMDKTAFLERQHDAIEKDVDGYFRTKTLSDMWRMLGEQISVAGDSNRVDVTEGVVNEMFRALKRRQAEWQKLITDEVNHYSRPGADTEGLQGLQDWLVALANDQMANLDDERETGKPGYLTRFREDFEPLVSPNFMAQAAIELDTIMAAYIDLAAHCTNSFISLIFNIDFRSTMGELFTAKWYAEFGMKRMTSTFEDYIADYADVLHRSLLDILYEQISETLLIRYLLAVRNKGVKFRRADPFGDKIRDDILTARAFFETIRGFDCANIVEGPWRAAYFMIEFVQSEKIGIPVVFERCKQEFWDVQMTWVESVLRTRDDYERAMLNAVKAKAAEVYVQRGQETVMSKVK